MDCQHEPDFDTCVAAKSSQVGLSELANNIVAFTIDYDPCPTLMVHPKADTAEEYAKDRIETMVRDTPRLRGKIDRLNSTQRQKRFDGGFISIVGANSSQDLSGKPIRKLILDDVDRFPPSVGHEGDPVDLAKVRTKTFSNRFIWAFSTPTIKRLSRIEMLWEKSDQRRWFVSCPNCKQLQFLKWRQVKFHNHDPETARYECDNSECKTRWTQPELNESVLAGVWIATKPENRKHRIAGFHVWEIYSPWSSMREIVEKFLDCKNIPDRLRVWKNTCLGESDEIEGTGVENSKLMDRQEDYGGYDATIPNQRPKIPNTILIIIASVDVQKDRLEVFIAGFGLDEELWAIQKVDFTGDPTRGEVWGRIDSFLQEKYQREDGLELRIASAFVDSGDKAQHVYAFTQPRQKRNIFACKGSSFPNKPIVGKAKRVGPRRVALFEIGTDTAKDMIYGRLAMDRGELEACPGFIHFPKGFGFDFEYFEQLTAEKYTIKFRNGVPFRAWQNVRPNKRNEALDLMVYAFAAFYNLRANMSKIARKLETKLVSAKAQAKPEVEIVKAPEENIIQQEANADAKPETTKPKRTIRKRMRGGFLFNYGKF